MGVLLGGVSAAKVSSWRYGGIISETYAQHLEAVAEANRQTNLVDELNDKLTAKAAEAEALRNQEREVVEREIIKEVIRYVETPNANECGLTDAGVRLHDAAARGRVPEVSDAAPFVDDSAIQATNAELILTVTKNYALCNAEISRFEGLQEWLNELIRRGNSDR